MTQLTTAGLLSKKKMKTKEERARVTQVMLSQLQKASFLAAQLGEAGGKRGRREWQRERREERREEVRGRQRGARLPL